MDYTNWISGDFHGFREHRLVIDEFVTIVVAEPETSAPGLPWYWRARFYGAFPDGDIAMLKLGWHVAHITIDDLFGSPTAVKRMNYLYDFMTRNGFSPRPAVVGYSRGGLAVYNWARENIGHFSSLYLDNPVCDFRSWPRGRSPEDWRKCLDAYHLTEETALAYPGNPVDNLEIFARNRTPILHVVSDADEVVVPEENTAVVEARLQAMGYRIAVIHKPGTGHHPHCLTDPAPIVKFVLEAYLRGVN